jgi:hypothetical protein
MPDESPTVGGDSPADRNATTEEDIAQSPTPLSDGDAGDTGVSALLWLWVIPVLAVIGGGLAIFLTRRRGRNQGKR